MMRRCLPLVLPLTALMTAIFPSRAVGQQIAVNASGELGTAVLRTRPSDANCYAITPDHVVANAAAIQVTDPTGRTSAASLSREYAAADLAIIGISDASFCSAANWPAAGNAADSPATLLQAAGATAKLERVSGAGSVGEIAVSINAFDAGKVIVAPQPGSQIQTGWSGSALYLNDVLVGVLLNVDLVTGYGTVSRRDYVESITSDFFSAAPGPRDAFESAVLSIEFRNRLKSIVDALNANKLGDFKGTYISYDTTTNDVSYRSTLQLPGFGSPGTLEIHNRGSYTSREKLDKTPNNLVYEEDFIVASEKLLKERFDTLSSVVTAAVPTWTSNSYSGPHSERNEFSNGKVHITVTRFINTFTLTFLPHP